MRTEKRYTGLCRLRPPDRRQAPGAAQPAARRASRYRAGRGKREERYCAYTDLRGGASWIYEVKK